MLSRTHRFHGLNALNFAHKQGQVVRGQAISLKYALNQRRHTYRVAVVVSKKVSKSAVVRNRIRRRVYEAARTQAGLITKPYDLIFMVYGDSVATIPAADLQKTVSDQLRKAGVTL
ncbi:MAG TPA: ribonuclease P protein component [Candidatus Saccharimonadales bacterium]